MNYANPDNPNPETNYNRPQVDPYTFAMRKIMYGLKKALPNSGRMSEYEFNTLMMIRTVIEHRDPESLNITIDKR